MLEVFVLNFGSLRASKQKLCRSFCLACFSPMIYNAFMILLCSLPAPSLTCNELEYSVKCIINPCTSRVNYAITELSHCQALIQGHIMDFYRNKLHIANFFFASRHLVACMYCLLLKHGRKIGYHENNLK